MNKGTDPADKVIVLVSQNYCFKTESMYGTILLCKIVSQLEWCGVRFTMSLSREMEMHF